MLRIKVEGDSNRFMVYASGRLTGLSVSQLERCWKSMSDASAGSPIRLDLGGITSVDKSAKTLLSQMVPTLRLRFANKPTARESEREIWFRGAAE